MPIQFPDINRISFDEANPWLTGFNRGADTTQKFMMNPQKLKEAMLANEMNQVKAHYAPLMAPEELKKIQQENKYNPRLWESTINSQSAQAGLSKAEADKIQYLLNHPGYMAGGDAKTIQYLIDTGALDPNTLKSNNQPSGGQYTPIPQNQEQGQQSIQMQVPQNNAQQGLFNTGNPLVNSILNKGLIESKYRQQMAQGYNWAHLPGDAKNQLIYQGYGMGIDPIQMQNYVNEGLNIQQIAKREGLDPNNIPSPVYPPTTGTLTRTQQVEQVTHELDYLTSATTPIIAEYADTIAGISPEKWKDMVSSDPEAQKRFGRYIGALSLQSGIANGRVLAEGGRSGLEVMKIVKEGALAGIDQHAPFKMSKISFIEAQKTIDEKLQKGAKIRTTTGMNPFGNIGKKMSENNNSNIDMSQVSDEELKRIAGGG